MYLSSESLAFSRSPLMPKHARSQTMPTGGSFCDILEHISRKWSPKIVKFICWGKKAVWRGQLSVCPFLAACLFMLHASAGHPATASASNPIHTDRVDSRQLICIHRMSDVSLSYT